MKTLLLCFLLMSHLSYSQEEYSQAECQNLFNEGNILKYKNAVMYSGMVTVENGYHYERFGDSKSVLKSKIEWLSDCEVKLTLIKVKHNKDLKKGQYLVLRIVGIYENEYTYEVLNIKGGSTGVLVIQN
jgi:hypothetical protein